MEAKVCVLLPVYNSEDAVADVLDSILEQSFVDYKILVVDDGSTDNTAAIVKKYKSPNLEVLRFKEKIGTVNALNWSLSEITQPYIIRADVNSLSVNNRFEELVYFMDNNPEIGVCGSLVAERKKDVKSESKDKVPVIKHDELAAQMLLQNPLKRGSMIIRSSLLQQKGFRLSDKYKQMEDYDLWYRMRNETRFAVINKPLLYNRPNGYHNSENLYQEYRSEALSFYLKKLLEFGIKPSDRELKLHLDLSDIAKINKLSNPLAYKEWLEKLNLRNNEVESFPVDALGKFLEQKWIDLFEVVVEKKNKRIVEYMKADGKSKLEIASFLISHSLKKLFN